MDLCITEFINKAKGYALNSCAYIDMEDLEGIKENDMFLEEQFCFAFKEEDKQYHIFWGATDKESFFQGLEKTLNAISQSYNTEKRIYIQFIEKDFIEALKGMGFVVDANFIDFWIKDLENLKIPDPTYMDIGLIQKEEYKEAAEVTQSCARMSNGFTGETESFVKEWSEDQNNCIFVAKSNDLIVGVCCMGLYGFDSDQGTVAWLRELAVHPDFQGRKIGYSLISRGITWGKEMGAKRSFLAADAENHNAVRLYKHFGYVPKGEYGEINMAKYQE